MPKPQTEEQFPLLLFLVGEQDASHNNKRFTNKGRFDGITTGASAIITQWPNYLSSCWVTSIICGVTLFIVTVMLSSCMTLQYHHRLPRCVPTYQLDNKTIHLVHSSTKWSLQQLELLDNITKAFPHYKIHLVLIQNKILPPNETTKEVNSTVNQRNHIMKILTGSYLSTIEDYLDSHPNVLVTRTTYREVFKNTPLFIQWVELSKQLRIFAIRILQMWQFGGLSFDLMEFKVPPPRRYVNMTNFAEKKLKKYIKGGLQEYEKLHPDIVSVDYNGLHMECKTPCHAFFGKILMKLKRASEHSTPRGLLKGPLASFCAAGVVDKKFCHGRNVVFI